MNWGKIDGIPALSSRIKGQSARKPQGLTESLGHLPTRVTSPGVFFGNPEICMSVRISWANGVDVLSLERHQWFLGMLSAAFFYFLNSWKNGCHPNSVIWGAARDSPGSPQTAVFFQTSHIAPGSPLASQKIETRWNELKYPSQPYSPSAMSEGK